MLRKWGLHPFDRRDQSVGVTQPEPENPRSEERPRHIPAWVPLQHPAFRALWIASLVSNLGSWMHEVGAAWLMTTLAPTPFMVGLVPAAASLPIFLLALPAGALADVFDRRRLLVVTQTYMVFCAGTLAALTEARLTGPWILLQFTLLLAVGNALTWPAWQTLIPELVPPREVPAAIALGGIAFNLSRIGGPALGGYIIGKFGVGIVFFANALSFVAVVLVLVFWRRPPQPPRRSEPFWASMKSGLVYVRRSRPLRAILWRTAGIITGGSAFWALLPLLARKELGLNSTQYGLLLGWFGGGAVAGGVLLPRVRHHVSTNAILTWGTAGIALHLVLLAWLRHPAAVDVLMIAGGVCWSGVMLTLNISVLHLAPDWIRSRTAAVYLLVFTGCQALASALWGAVGESVGMGNALITAGVLLLLIGPALARANVPDEGGIDG